MSLLASIETHHIVLGSIACILLAFAGYRVIGALKGKILIEIPKKGFVGGEEITGRVTLVTRKALNLNRMYVALIGYEIIKRHGSDGKSSTRKNEVYRNEVNILEAQPVPAGVNQAFDFTMSAPGGTASPVAEIANKLSDALGAAAGVLSAFGVSTGSRRMEWRIEARADLPGVDISKAIKVRVN